MFRDKKGIYTILSTFFFIILAVAVVIVLIYYGGFMASAEKKASSSMNVRDLVLDAKDKLVYCYGTPMQNINTKDCNVSLIDGYTIQTIDYGSCSNTTLKDFGDYADSKNRFVFFVSILNETDGTNCLGKVEVYI